MTSEYLKVKIRLSQKRKKLSKRNKKYLSLFYKCSLLDIRKKPAKMLRMQSLRILTGKKHPKIKLKLTKNTDMDIWVAGTLN